MSLPEPTVYRDPAELAKLTRALRSTGRRIALVPTMGALHEGHLELINRARHVPGVVVVVSIFVNPLQFGPSEDFDSYPRTMDEDLRACAESGAEYIFTPGVNEMYPEGANTITVRPGPLGEELEGAHREGHFAGVLTVVSKLFNIVRPDFAYFGEKDYQQLILIKRMAAELNMDVEVRGVPTVRGADGLAISSRNNYLSAEERESALAISAALTAARSRAVDGAEAALAVAREVLAARTEVVPDYVELRAPNLGPAPESGPARLLIAAKVGDTRLIDNAELTLGTAHGAGTE